MSTGIQWTDETWNPVVGCDQVSPGCAHCYAKTLHDMRHKAFLAGKKLAPQYAVAFETVQLLPERLRVPLSWGRARRVFVNSVSDLFHEDVPTAYIDQVFAVMAIARQHTFQILTKRPARMAEYLRGERVRYAVWDAADRFCRGDKALRWRDTYVAVPVAVPGGGPAGCYVRDWPLPNVWLGVSVENQRWANERVRLLRQTPAAVRFLSVEPQLESIEFAEAGGLDGIHWVIVGGESGKDARKFVAQWAIDIVTQCREAGVAPFVKQLGAWPVLDGARLALRDSHGGDMAEWPEDLRVREFPV